MVELQDIGFTKNINGFYKCFIYYVRYYAMLGFIYSLVISVTGGKIDSFPLWVSFTELLKLVVSYTVAFTFRYQF